MSEYQYSVGERVEIDWLGSVGRRKQKKYKGFILKNNQNGSYEVLRDLDGKQKSTPGHNLRSISLDPVGFVYAASHGIFETVKKWTEDGNDVNVTIDGFSAVDLACYNGQLEIVEYLIDEANANSNTMNFHFFGAKPLDLAFLSVKKSVMNYAVHRQLQCTSVSQILPSKSFHFAHFTSKAISFFQDYECQSPKFIRVEDFLNFENGCETFSKCHNLGLHVQSHNLAPNSRILFVSHRWDDKYAPDPSGNQYSTICKFLHDHVDICYLWMDCMCLDASQPFSPSKHLHTITSALFQSTHFLVVPKLRKLRCIDEQFPRARQLLFITDIRNYLSRAWGAFEMLVAMLSGCTLYCSVFLHTVVEECIQIASIVNFSGQREGLELQQAVTNAIAEHMTDSNGLAARTYLFRIATHLTDPAIKLSDLVVVALTLSQNEVFARKLLTGQLSLKDLSKHKVNLVSGQHSLEGIARRIGKAEVEEDYPIVLRGLLLVIMYSMDKLPAGSLTKTIPPAHPISNTEAKLMNRNEDGSSFIVSESSEDECKSIENSTVNNVSPEMEKINSMYKASEDTLNDLQKVLEISLDSSKGKDEGALEAKDSSSVSSAHGTLSTAHYKEIGFPVEVHRQEAFNEAPRGFNEMGVLWNQAPISKISYCPAVTPQPQVMERGMSDSKQNRSAGATDPEKTPEDSSKRYRPDNSRHLEEDFDGSHHGFFCNDCFFAHRICCNCHLG